MAITRPLGHTAAIRPYFVQEPSPAYQLLVRLARRAPWWSLSLAVHLAAVVTVWQVPYRPRPPESVPVGLVVELTDGQRYVELAEPAPPPPAEPTEADVPTAPEEPLPLVELSYDEPEPEVEPVPMVADPLEALAPPPMVAPPAATPVFELEPPFAQAREIYGARSRRGRAQAVGGRGGTTPRAEGAVQAGLRWLARAQEPDGSWSCRRWGGSGSHGVGVTGLALLAFLGAGYTQEKGPFRATIRRGLAWLHAGQRPNGQFPWRTFYEQGIATLAVTEAHALTASPQLRRMAQQAVDYLCETQPEHGGVRYGGPVPRQEGDLSVTAWQIMALKSASAAGLDVPPQAFDRARAFLDAVDRGEGRSAYLVGKAEPAAGPTAIGMLCRLFLGGDEETVRAAAAWLLDHVQSDGAPGQGRGRLVGDLYFTYYATTALFQVGGEPWAAWNALFREPLVETQVTTVRGRRRRSLHGSWEPAAHAWGRRGGRVYTTAMALLSLEAYYRFLPVYHR
ncbi:MAG: prenyltransferase/squalene oxidase repeat-containing protein [bacterium]